MNQSLVFHAYVQLSRIQSTRISRNGLYEHWHYHSNFLTANPVHWEPPRSRVVILSVSKRYSRHSGAYPGNICPRILRHD